MVKEKKEREEELTDTLRYVRNKFWYTYIYHDIDGNTCFKVLLPENNINNMKKRTLYKYNWRIK